MNIKTLGAKSSYLLALMFAFTACQVSGQKNEQVSTSAKEQAIEQTMDSTVKPNALDGKYLVIELKGKDMQGLDSQDRPTMLINLLEKSVGGSTGCNSYMGAIDLGEEGSISFKEVMSTLRACPDGNPEGVFTQALYAVRKYRFAEGKSDTLQLLDAEGKPLMTLLREQK